MFTSHGINEGRDNKSQLVLAKQGDYEEKSGKIKREYFFEKYKEYKNGTFNSLEKTRNDFKKEYFDRIEEVRKSTVKIA